MLPNFFVLGAQKAGTTSLHNFLSGHPDMFLPEQKETQFFARDREWEKGLEYYQLKYFVDARNQKAVGEIDPEYMFNELVPERLLKAYGDLSSLKLIFILRNPIDRAFSHYLMTLRRGFEPLSFTDAIAAEPQRLLTADFDKRVHFSYLSRGRYFEQIERFLKLVDVKQIMVLFSDDLNNKPLTVVRQVCSFLGISEDYIPANINERFHEATKPRFLYMRRFFGNAGFLKKTFRLIFPFVTVRRNLMMKVLAWNDTGSYKEKPVLQGATRSVLRQYFNDDIVELEKFCQRDLSDWV